jgi:hypothetical protein
MLLKEPIWSHRTPPPPLMSFPEKKPHVPLEGEDGIGSDMMIANDKVVTAEPSGPKSVAMFTFGISDQ